MMQKINKQTVDEVAHLARLEFNEAEKEEILKDMNNMLQFIEKINEVDTTDVEPLVYLNTEKSLTREDVAQKTITKQEALKNAPDKDSDYFKVPKVINR